MVTYAATGGTVSTSGLYTAGTTAGTMGDRGAAGRDQGRHQRAHGDGDHAATGGGRRAGPDAVADGDGEGDRT